MSGERATRGNALEIHPIMKSRKISFAHLYFFFQPIISKFYLKHGYIIAILCSKWSNNHVVLKEVYTTEKS